MSIRMATPLAVGNAVRLLLEVPAGAVRTRILRATAPYISGPDDSNAVIVCEGVIQGALDTDCDNGLQYWYQAYHYIAGDWLAGGGLVKAIPKATYVDNSVDVLQVLLDRIKRGLAVEVARGTLSHQSGEILVLSAPPVFDETVFPMVTVHLGSDAPGERFLGEQIGLDLQEDNQWVEQEGWLAAWSLEVIAWSLNADERITLRQAVKRILVANLAVFDALGIIDFTPTFSDQEDFQSYNAYIYQAMCTITCKAPVAVGGPVDVIEDIIVTSSEAPA